MLKQYILLFLFLISGNVLWSQTVAITCDPASFSACEPAYNVKFTAQVAGMGSKTVKSYTWNLSDKNGEYTLPYPDGMAQAPQYEVAGAYPITLKVTFSDGTTATATSKVFTVIESPKLNIGTTPNDICVNSSIHFNVTNGVPNSSYYWQFAYDNGYTETKTASGSSLDYLFTKAGNNITALVLATAAAGCPAYATTTVNVYDTPKPDFSILSAEPYCDNTLQLQNTTTGGGGAMQYKWLFDGQSLPADIQTSITTFSKTLTTGRHRVQLATDGTKGCNANSAYYKDFYIGKPVITIQPDKNSPLCSEQLVNFTPSISTADYDRGYYHWQIDGVDVQGGETMAYTFTKEGAQNVTVTSDRNCITTGTVTMEIFKMPSLGFSSVVTTVCPEFTLALTNTSNMTEGNFDYTWTLNNQAPVNAVNPPVQNITGATSSYPVTLSAYNKGLPTCRASISRNIAIENTKLIVTLSATSGCPLTKFSAEATPETPIAADDAILEYRWDWGDGSAVETTTVPQSPIHLYSSENTYSLKVTATTQKGCSLLSATAAIKVEAACPVPTNGSNTEIGISTSGYNCQNKFNYTLTNQAGGTNIKWSFANPSVRITSADNINTITVTLPTSTESVPYYGTLKRTVNGKEETVPFYITLINETVGITLPGNPICSNINLPFGASVANPAYINSYNWSFEGVPLNNVSAAQVSHGFAQNGTHSVDLTIRDKNGCTASANGSLTTVGPHADFKILADAPAVIKNNVLTTCNLNSSGTLEDLSQSYDNSAQTALASWEWRLPDNQSATGKNPTVTFSNNYTVYREYRVQLKVTDVQGCSDTLTQMVAKAYYPAVSYSGNNQERCPLVDNGVYTYTFSNSSQAQNGVYTWDFGDGSTAATVLDKSAQTHRYPDLLPAETEHYYTPVLSAVDENGCTSTTANNISYSNFVKLVRPVASFTLQHASSDCIPNQVGITNSSIHGISYDWDYWGDQSAVYNQTTGKPAPDFYIYDKRVGDYNLTLTVNGPDGCKATHAEAVHLKGPLGTLIQNPAEDQSKCVPYYPHLIVQNTTAESFSWNFGDNSITDQYANDAAPGFAYTRSGLYNPVVTMYGQGCSYSLKLEPNVPIIVYDVPAPSINPLAADAFCEGTQLTLQGNTGSVEYDPEGKPYQYSYVWQPSDGNNNDLTMTVTPKATTTYRLSVGNGICRGVSDPVTVVIKNKPVLDMPARLLICKPQQDAADFAVKIANADNLTWLAAPDLQQTGEYSFHTTARQNTSYQFTASSSDNICPPTTQGVNVVVANSPVINNIMLRLGRIVPEVYVDPAAGPINAGQQVTLRPDASGGLATDSLYYLWEPRYGLNSYTAKFPIFYSDKNIEYKLTLSNEYGCAVEQAVPITVSDIADSKKYQLNVANAFTPNQDGKNDYFYISGFGIDKVLNFVIYNRWGKVMYQRAGISPNNPSDGWDGTANGQPQPTETYIYMANIQTVEGKIYPVKGSFVLIR